MSKTEPTYVPNGYQLRRRVSGSNTIPGFRGASSETTFWYTRGQQGDDWAFPILVTIASSDAGELATVENHPGQAIALSASLSAEYKDGMWASGPGEDQIGSGADVAHWERGTAHALIARTAERAIAVQAPRDRGAELGELTKILRSLVE